MYQLNFILQEVRIPRNPKFHNTFAGPVLKPGSVLTTQDASAKP